MPIVRVIETVAVQEPESETWITLAKGADYDSSDPLVRSYPWAFQRDADVEQATAGPGEKRNR
jgi:hypothetical protein